MKIDRSRRKKDLVLNIAPLIDIVFLLLIFFMVATTFDNRGGFKLDLPEARTKKDISKIKDIQVVVDKDKNIFIRYENDKKFVSENTNLENLSKSINTKLENANIKSVIISADKNIDYGYIVSIMSLIKEAGAETINIDTTLKR